MKMQVQIDEDKSINLSEKPKKIKKEFLKLAGKKVYNNVRDKTPVRGGTLKGNWKLKTTEEEARITNNTEYALYVEKGTGIYGPRRHLIFPKSAPFLQFEIDGQIIRALSVRGMPAVGMAEKSVEDIETQLPTLFKQACDKNE